MLIPLCNVQILQSQTGETDKAFGFWNSQLLTLRRKKAALRHVLGSQFQFHFLEGAYPWPASSGIRETFGADQACFSYTNGTASNTIDVVSDLAEYLHENGPFDLVIAFSLGAAVITTLLLRDAAGGGDGGVSQATKNIKSLVLLSGTLPMDWSSLTQGIMRPRRAAEVDESQRIQIPTVHVWDEKDPEYPGQSAQVLLMYGGKERIEVRHDVGHRVPSHPRTVGLIAEGIQQLARHW